MIMIVLKVRFSKAPIFARRNQKNGIKASMNVQVISKLINSLPILLTPFNLSFLDVHMIKGTKTPSKGKNINDSADKFRKIKYPMSSFIVQSINSSGLIFKAFDILLIVSPVGLLSPFSIR